MTGEDDDTGDDGYVEIEVDEAALDDHVRRYRAFVVRLLTWKAQPRLPGPGALELLEEHGRLIEEIGVPQLTRHLFDETASSLPLDAKGDYSAAGKLLAGAEFNYRIGQVYLAAGPAYLIAGDLKRMSEGGASILASEVQRAKKPFTDMEAEVFRRIVLLAEFLAGLESGRWTDKVLLVIDARTLRRWAADLKVSSADRVRARDIGELVARQEKLDADQCAFRDDITKDSMEEVVRALRALPRASGW